MSSQEAFRDKLERGTSLSKEQYHLIVNFLKTGVKPSVPDLKAAGLSGTLNGGEQHPNTSTYQRFKSIAKRLRYRELDQELVFKTNNKIVLPRSRFEEVIKEAHGNGGYKHLNITRTLDKLSIHYTTGCRQFGICEPTVRVVVKKCREGSCAGKHKHSGLSVSINTKVSGVWNAKYGLGKKLRSKGKSPPSKRAAAPNQKASTSQPPTKKKRSSGKKAAKKPSSTVSKQATSDPQVLQPQPIPNATPPVMHNIPPQVISQAHSMAGMLPPAYGIPPATPGFPVPPHGFPPGHKLGIPIQMVRLPNGQFAMHGLPFNFPSTFKLQVSPVSTSIEPNNQAQFPNQGNQSNFPSAPKCVNLDTDSASNKMPHLANILASTPVSFHSGNTNRFTVKLPSDQYQALQNVPQVVVLSANQIARCPIIAPAACNPISNMVPNIPPQNWRPTVNQGNDVNNNILSETDQHIIVNTLDGNGDVQQPGSFNILQNAVPVMPVSSGNGFIDLAASSHLPDNLIPVSGQPGTNQDSLNQTTTQVSEESQMSAAEGGYVISKPETSKDGRRHTSYMLNCNANDNVPMEEKTPFDSIIDTIHGMRGDLNRALAGSVAATNKLKLKMSAAEHQIGNYKAMCGMYKD